MGKVGLLVLMLHIAEMMMGVLHAEDCGKQFFSKWLVFLQKPHGGNDVVWRVLLTSMDMAEVVLCFHSDVVGG